MASSEYKFQLDRFITSSGIILTDIELNGTDKIRFKLEGVAGNEITVRVKLKGQSSYTDLQVVDMSSEYVVNTDTYDFIEIECTTFTGNFTLLASGNIVYGN